MADKQATSNTAKLKALASKVAKKGTGEENEGEYTYKKAVIEVPKVRYKKPTEYSISRVGLEVYVTDEDNYVPYVPTMSSGVSTEDTKTDEESEDEEEETDETATEESTDEEENVGYKLHMGEILSTTYWGAFESASFESDYKEMTGSATLKIKSINLEKAYKGVRVHLLSAWDKGTSEKFQWSNLESALLGFIIEQSFADSQMTIKLGSMTKTMEMKYKFDFKQMRRSEIINQVILTAGLKPFINVDGLDDDITDFTNISSSGSSDGSSSDLAGGEGEEIDSLVRKIVGSERDELKKCKLIHEWLKQNVRYEYYECTRYNTPEKCLANKGHLNCADTARLTRAMMSSAGLNAYVVHRTTNGGHFWTIIEIGGKKYASDQTGSGSEFNTVWASSGRTSVSDGGSYTRKNGDNPDC